MREPKKPTNERRRLERLSAYDVLDTMPEQTYDDIVSLAARICDVPISLVSLVDEGRQWFKARHGLEAPETPRNVSFCGHVVETSTPLFIDDAYQDERFADNPLVVGEPRVRFYAGAPLRTEDGLVLGTLCVIDHVPRTLDASQKAMLESLSRLVMSQLSLRLEVRRGDKLMQKAEEARVAAEAADSSKSQFLATMSHELRTPLNSIIGFSNILGKNKAENLEDTDLKMLSRIHENGTHLLEMINEILDISKIESGKMSYQATACEIGTIVDTVVRLQESLAQENGLDVCVDIPEGLDSFRADEHRLRQVLINLVSNAIKFTEKGAIIIRVVPRANTRKIAAIEVVDSGIGISEEDLEKVFRPFEQVDGGASRSQSGTGLGLAISRSLCEGMGLSLELESEKGRGSTFRIAVPMALSDGVATSE